jgi:hypothetical protein
MAILLIELLLLVILISIFMRRVQKKKVGGGGFLSGIAEQVVDKFTRESEIPHLSSLVDKRGKTGEFLFTKEGIYSISSPARAEEIAKLIAAHHQDPKKLTICDLTACNGGDTIAFARAFGRVYSVELSPDNYAALVHNIHIYPKLTKLITPICGDLRAVIAEPPCPFDVIHMDPPWGGLDYKDKGPLRFDIGGTPLTEIVVAASKISKHISVKLPRNFDCDWLAAALDWTVQKDELKGMILMQFTNDAQ